MSYSFASGLFGPSPHLGSHRGITASRGCLDLQDHGFPEAGSAWICRVVSSVMLLLSRGGVPQTQALGPALSSAVGDPAGTLPPCSLFTSRAGLQLQGFLGTSKAVGDRGASRPQDTLVNSMPSASWPCDNHAAVTQWRLFTKINLPYKRTMPSTA